MLYSKKYYILKYQLFIITVSLSLWVYLLGVDYIKPTNIEWLHSGDLSINQIGWNFFKNDDWSWSKRSYSFKYSLYI